MERSIKNAQITSASIIIESGMLSSFVGLDYGGLHQGFGGYRLDGKPMKGFYHFCSKYLMAVMIVAGVESWDKVTGKYVRVDSDWNKVYKIGHIIKDIWYDPSTNTISGTDYRP